MRLLSGLLACLCVPLTAATEPGEVALRFTEKLRAGTIDMRPGVDTALSTNTSEEKIRIISRQLSRLSVVLKDSRLEIGPIKVESDLAGVLVRAINQTNFSQCHVLPLAMIKHGDSWKIAPMPASYENTHVMHRRDLRDLAKQIETWLVTENVREIERMRASSAQRTRKELAKVVSPETMRSWSAMQVVDAYLNACNRRESRAIQALSGGLSESLPEYWAAFTTDLHTALSADPDKSSVWSFLLHANHLLVPLMEDEINPDLRLIHVLCLSPELGFDDAFECLRLKISRDSSGLWSVAPPRIESSRRIRASMLDLFPSRFQIRNPSTPSSSAEQLADRFMTVLSSGQGNEWADLILMTGEPADQLRACYQAASIWLKAKDPEQPIISIKLELKESEDHAYLAVQWLSMGNLGFVSQIFHLAKTPSGWLWNAHPSAQQISDAQEWTDERQEKWKESYLTRALTPCPVADFTQDAPSEDEAASIVESWLSALGRGDWQNAISNCAQLNTPRTPRIFLRNLSADGKHVFSHRNQLAIISKLRGKHLTLVTTQKANDAEGADLIIPVVNTVSGARILQEIDLGNPSRRGRAFLNRESIERLSEVHEAAANELETMLDTLTKPDE